MSRITLIRDRQGEKRCHAGDYPLTIGGPGAAIQIPGIDSALAYVGQEQGHSFIQAIEGETATPVWHNHERLFGSTWLKSGDQLQIGQSIVLWRVQGDQITVSVTDDNPEPAAPAPLTPPTSPPPALETETYPTPGSTRGAHPVLRWTLFGTFALLVLTAAFVIFSARVNLEVEPQPEYLSLRGFPPALLLENHALAVPGHYTLHAGRTGYLELVEPIEVILGKSQSYRFALEKAPGLLSLSSTPAGADLLVDGKWLGKTPLEDLELAPGHHRIRLEAPRHLPVEQELEIIGMGQRQRMALGLVANWAPVTLQSVPEGAELIEDGRILGTTPLVAELAFGEHQLRLRKTGYKTYDMKVRVEANRSQDIPPVKLVELEGTIRLTSDPAGGVVTVDDKFEGRTPLELNLTPRAKHVIRISKAGFAPKRLDIELTPGEEREVSARLDREYGTVFLSIQPADAEVIIDGKSKGSAIARLRLPTRPHQIEIRKNGYKPYRTTITPRNGISQNIEVALGASGRTQASGNDLTTAAGQRLHRIHPKRPFTLGASRREPGRRANENLRQVEVTRPYYIATKEVTNAEFRRFRGNHDSGRFSGFSLDGDTQPVAGISWDDTARYLNWLSAQDNLPLAYEERNGRMVLIRPVTTGYRLPTEAEWAYAARYAGRNDAAQYPWGARTFPPPGVQGNYADGSAQSILPVVIDGYSDGYPISAPVGSFDGNPLGLFDVDGNVAEWCLDHYAVYPVAENRMIKDPLGPETGRHHVVRGSSWRDASITELRLSYRDYAEKPRNDLGFRVVRYAQ